MPGFSGRGKPIEEWTTPEIWVWMIMFIAGGIFLVVVTTVGARAGSPAWSKWFLGAMGICIAIAPLRTGLKELRRRKLNDENREKVD